MTLRKIIREKGLTFPLICDIIQTRGEAMDLNELIEKIKELQDQGYYGTDWREENAYQYALKRVLNILEGKDEISG